MLLNTGVYGCVFSGNANTVNTCLDANPVSNDYGMDADGKVVMSDNGYPVPTQEAIDAGKIDTAKFPSPVTLSDDSSALNTSIYAFTTTSLLAIVLLATL